MGRLQFETSPGKKTSKVHKTSSQPMTVYSATLLSFPSTYGEAHKWDDSGSSRSGHEVRPYLTITNIRRPLGHRSRGGALV
jgi:hypothetical protein